MNLQEEINRIKSLIEGVGDKYAEKEFGIPDTENNFTPNDFESEEIVLRRENNNPVIKNPVNPQIIGNHARGVIDKEGNLYIEKHPIDIHHSIINDLANNNIINVDKNVLIWGLGMPPLWNLMNPDESGFISVQKDNDKIYIGYSHHPFVYSSSIEDRYTKEEKLEIFKKYLSKAKIKNPKIIFVPQLIEYDTNPMK